MVNSVLAYFDGAWWDAERVLSWELSREWSYLAEYVGEFGREFVADIVQGQIDSIARIDRDIMTDGEGLSYNGIVWKDEV
jgi:hypothetical protein